MPGLRLTVFGHAATVEMQELVFGDLSSVHHPELVPEVAHRVASWSCGPEPACVETGRRLAGEDREGWAPAKVNQLSGLDAGSWAQRSAALVAEEDPAGLRAWLSDPHAVPHGGESLSSLIDRVGRFCDEHPWPPGRSVAVVTPLVARAIAVHALGAAPEVIFRIDVTPLGRVGLSRSGSIWRLQQLGPES